MSVNVPLLRKAVEWVESQPEVPRPRHSLHDHDEVYWDQEVWGRKQHCGTALCLAGYVTWLEGWKPVASNSPRGGFTARDGETAYIPDLAVELLGITKQQSDELFFGGNTAADIRSVAEKIAGEPL